MTTATAPRKFSGQTIRTFLAGAGVKFTDIFYAAAVLHGIVSDGRALFRTSKKIDLQLPVMDEPLTARLTSYLRSCEQILSCHTGRPLGLQEELTHENLALFRDEYGKGYTADPKLIATVRRHVDNGSRLRWYTLAEDERERSIRRICGEVDGRVVAVVMLCT
jgi:hypothetical protein